MIRSDREQRGWGREIEKMSEEDISYDCGKGTWGSILEGLFEEVTFQRNPHE